MKNRFILVLLIISLGLNIGTFSILLFEKLHKNIKSGTFIYNNDMLEELNLTEDQEKKIDNLRMAWFENNDSLINKFDILEKEINSSGEIDESRIDSLEKAVSMLEDSHQILFERYLEDYEKILTKEQLKTFKSKVNPKLKFVKIKIDSQNNEKNVNVEIINKTVTDSTRR